MATSLTRNSKHRMEPFSGSVQVFINVKPLHLNHLTAFKCKTTETRDNDLNYSRNDNSHKVFPDRSDAKLEQKKNQQVPVKSKLQAVGVRRKSFSVSSSCRSAINRALNRHKVNERSTELPIVDTDILRYQSNTKIFTIFEILHRDVKLCDETFKFCPIQIYYFYIIHFQLAGFNPSCFYALLRSKREHTYKIF